MSEGRRDFAALVALMHRLRSPGGCPWDAEQTHQSLRPYLIEEAYEVLDAINGGDDRELRDELGDLLLQVIFHAELAQERGAFTIDDVIEGLADKLVRRHPHVFADVEVGSAQDVERNWSAIKKSERKKAGRDRPSAIDGLPSGLPALARAKRIGEKAASAGFDWDRPEDVRAKVAEELAELDDAMRSGDDAAVEEEVGDLLFAIASMARLRRIDAESALAAALRKFDTRFRQLEREVESSGREIRQLDGRELEAIWQSVKKA
ncbi:MAG TPA: nucleoside triphosphate pyrophosphohydrolase [Candidatus Limnocylindrales bacterium]|nr:nucleoside triphosphate pyrophosphohydrolase [Candidatus Limnocylindrales bacterium]